MMTIAQNIPSELNSSFSPQYITGYNQFGSLGSGAPYLSGYVGMGAMNSIGIGQEPHYTQEEETMLTQENAPTITPDNALQTATNTENAAINTVKQEVNKIEKKVPDIKIYTIGGFIAGMALAKLAGKSMLAGGLLGGLLVGGYLYYESNHTMTTPVTTITPTSTGDLPHPDLTQSNTATTSTGDFPHPNLVQANS